MSTSPPHEAPIRPEQQYLAYLAQGRFMIQRSRATGEHVFYPRVAAPRSGDRDLEWVAASGRGMVHATTVVRARPPRSSYNVVLIDLAEGARLMSRAKVQVLTDDTAPQDG